MHVFCQKLLNCFGRLLKQFCVHTCILKEIAEMLSSILLSSISCHDLNSVESKESLVSMCPAGFLT